MIFWLGKKSRLFRRVYYKLTGRWYWGLYRVLDDSGWFLKGVPEPDENLDKFLKVIFELEKEK